MVYWRLVFRLKWSMERGQVNLRSENELTLRRCGKWVGTRAKEDRFTGGGSMRRCHKRKYVGHNAGTTVANHTQHRNSCPLS